MLDEARAISDTMVTYQASVFTFSVTLISVFVFF